MQRHYPKGAAYPDADKIASYVESGVMCVGSPGAVSDVISGEEATIGSGSLLTDGIYVWPDDLPYYIRNYRLLLPDDFIAHVRQRQHLAPREAKIDLSAIEM